MNCHNKCNNTNNNINNNNKYNNNCNKNNHVNNNDCNNTNNTNNNNNNCNNRNNNSNNNNSDKNSNNNCNNSKNQSKNNDNSNNDGHRNSTSNTCSNSRAPQTPGHPCTVPDSSSSKNNDVIAFAWFCIVLIKDVYQPVLLVQRQIAVRVHPHSVHSECVLLPKPTVAITICLGAHYNMPLSYGLVPNNFQHI